MKEPCSPEWASSHLTPLTSLNYFLFSSHPQDGNNLSHLLFLVGYYKERTRNTNSKETLTKLKGWKIIYDYFKA
jgi:hypothetical protein